MIVFILILVFFPTMCHDRLNLNISFLSAMVVVILILVFSPRMCHDRLHCNISFLWTTNARSLEPPNKAKFFQTLECKVLSCGLIISFSWGFTWAKAAWNRLKGAHVYRRQLLPPVVVYGMIIKWAITVSNTIDPFIHPQHLTPWLTTPR